MTGLSNFYYQVKIQSLIYIYITILEDIYSNVQKRFTNTWNMFSNTPEMMFANTFRLKLEPWSRSRHVALTPPVHRRQRYVVEHRRTGCTQTSSWCSYLFIYIYIHIYLYIYMAFIFIYIYVYLYIYIYLYLFIYIFFIYIYIYIDICRCLCIYFK